MTTEHRKICEVDVKLALSDLPFKCVACNKNLAADAKRCAGCQSVVYCGKECQKHDWQLGHKARCKLIRSETKNMQNAAAPLRVNKEAWQMQENNRGLRNITISHFEKNIGYFWGMPETRDYCRIRYNLIKAITGEALGRGNNVNTVALKMALEHSLDMISLNKSDNLGLRYNVPSLMIGLELYQEAYDFIKFWFVGKDEDSSTFLSIKNEDVTESLQHVNFKNSKKARKVPDSNAGLILDMALVKFSIYHTLRKVETVNNAFGNTDISAVLGEHVGARIAWSNSDSASILSQTKELLCCVNELNKFVLPGMMNTEDLLVMNPRSYDKGSREEAALVLQRSLFWWSRNKLAFRFLQYFVRNIAIESVPIARNDQKENVQAKTDRGRGNPTRPMSAMNYFENVKSSPAVVDLLTGIGAPQLLQGRYPGTVQICSALIRGKAATVENVRLIFGSTEAVHDTMRLI